MTTDLEKKFFNTFDIDMIITRPKVNIPSEFVGTTFTRAQYDREVYPEITDSILLSLVKIACKENIISLTRMKNGSKEWAVYFGLDKNCIFYEKSFKDVILRAFIEYSNDMDIYTRVQKLFKGE
jgi:hypothetical protein